MASRLGDEVARAEALREADAIGRLLDQLESEADWDVCKGSPEHG
jgi:hypothetical protein